MRNWRFGFSNVCIFFSRKQTVRADPIRSKSADDFFHEKNRAYFRADFTPSVGRAKVATHSWWELFWTARCNVAAHARPSRSNKFKHVPLCVLFARSVGEITAWRNKTALALLSSSFFSRLLRRPIAVQRKIEFWQNVALLLAQSPEWLLKINRMLDELHVQTLKYLINVLLRLEICALKFRRAGTLKLTKIRAQEKTERSPINPGIARACFPDKFSRDLPSGIYSAHLDKKSGCCSRREIAGGNAATQRDCVSGDARHE